MENFEQLFESLDDERIKAQVAKDRKVLSRLCSNDLVYIHSSGVVDDAISFTDLICNSDLNYNIISAIERNLIVGLPDLLVAYGQYLVVYDFGGDPTEISIIGTSVWRKRNDIWQLLRWQATKIE